MQKFIRGIYKIIGTFVLLLVITPLSVSAQSAGVAPTSMPLSQLPQPLVQAGGTQPTEQVLGQSGYTFTRTLTTGSVGEDVLRLQQWLNANGYLIAATGPGSPGNETTTFGRATANALIRFQEANASSILTPYGLTNGTGRFANATRAFINNLMRGGAVLGATDPQSLWSGSVSPAILLDSDSVSVELGLTFQSNVPGKVTGMKFYKGGWQNNGTHVGTLWDDDGRKLAEGTFSGESSSGWQVLMFSSPVSIEADTTYVVSYNAPNGRYSVTNGYFNSARSSGDLTALRSGGVYRYGGKAFPTQVYQNANYWVDVIFTSAETDNVPPTGVMTSPANNDTVSGVVTLKATASDNVGVAGVQFKIEGSNVGAEDTSAPYEAQWDSRTVPNSSGGSHYHPTITVRDYAGNTYTTDDDWSLYVNNVTAPAPDTTRPNLSFTEPGNKERVSGTSVTVSVNATDNVGVAGVQFKAAGANIGPEDTTAPYSVEWDSTTVPNGNRTLTAIVRDAAGNTRSKNRTVRVTNETTPPPSSDTSAPSISFSEPSPNETVSGTSVDISATASDNVGVVGVQFKIGNQFLGAEDTSSPYAINWNTTTLIDGSYQLSAIARDEAGNTSTATRTVVINNTPAPVADTTRPVVSFTAPGSTVSGTATAVTASASDNVGVVGVQFKLDGVNLGSEDIAAPYSISWNTTGSSNGTHQLAAIARDAAGNTATATKTITVNNVVLPAPDTSAPSVSVTSPTGGTQSGTVTITASASDNTGVAGVQFLLNGIALGTEDTSSPYSISWNTTSLANGSYTIAARARDAAGNMTTSSPRTVTVSNAVVTPPGSSYGTLTFSAGYDTSSEVNTNQGPLNTISTSVYKTGPGSFKSTVTPSTNVSSGYRGEMQYNGSSQNPTEGVVEYDVYYESPFSDNGHSIQWHPSSGTDSSTVALWHNGGKFQVVRQVTSGANIYQSGTLKSIQSNRWYHMRWEFKWSTGSDGYVRLYIDDELYYSFSGGRTQNGNSKPYLKVGQNRWNVNSTSVAYYDNLKIWDSSGSTGISNDTSAPSVSLGNPGSTLSGIKTISATATDNVGVARVEFYRSGSSTAIGIDAIPPYDISWNTTTVPNGTYTLTARAFDAAGNSTLSNARTVSVSNAALPAADTTAPTVSLTAPVGASILSGTTTLAALATDNVGVAGVTFKYGTSSGAVSTVIGSEDTSLPYTASWNTSSLSNGTYYLTATARDSAGNTRTSATIMVNVSNGTSGGSGGSSDDGGCNNPPTHSGYTLTFCSGYDSISDMTYAGNGQYGNGTISTSVYKTGPGSFYSRPQNISSGIRSEVQYTGAAQNPTEGITEYDVRYEVIVPNNGHSLQWHPNTSGGSASPGLWHINGKFVMVNWYQGGNYQYPTGVTIQPNKWYHIRMEHKFGSNGYFRLYIDDELKASWTGRVGDGSGQYLKVGYNGWDSNSANSRIYYDNLRVYKKN